MKEERGEWKVEKLELDEKNCQVVWNTSAEQAQSSLLGWRMMENNAILGILPFDYYYIDDQIYFRCSYAPLERIDCYFHKNQGNFESIFCICEGILKILERGEEYLLGKEGYLLLPEWVFWNRFEKKVAVCYLPGRRESARDEYMVLAEYLMRHTNHSDKRAVSLIYGLYDMLVSDSFIIEDLLLYLQKGGESEWTRTGEAKVDGRKESRGYFSLSPVKGSFTGGLQGRIAKERKTEVKLEEGRELVVGRQPDSDIYLPFAVISRKHAVIIYEENELYVIDLSSKNGTYLNGKKISAYVKTQCREKDVITFADISYRFEIPRNYH